MILCLGLCGCLSGFGRLNKPEDAEKEKDLGIRTVGDVTELANPGPWQVSGVGIVTGLAGTGHSPNGAYRKELEQQLLKQKVKNVTAFLDDPDHALVLITGFIYPGCAKGDPIDIEVTLPPGSKCTSLLGGYLHETVLWNHDDRRNLSPDSGKAGPLKGHVLARAKGDLIVGLGNREEPSEMRRGRIWEGGVSLVERPFYITLKTDEKSVRIAAEVAARINFMFQDDARKREAVLRNKQLFILEDVTQNINRTGEKLGRSEMAKAVGKEMIHVRVPYAYRYNPERYLLVVRNMPLREDAEKSSAYRKRLHEMLLEPRDTVRAAMRLEALGAESVPALKKGLAHEHPLVRFACAESLVYLNSLAGVEDLAKLAEDYPLLRMNCLLALASSEEGICKQKLTRMLGSPNMELRCGAFVVLRIGRDSKEDEPAFRNPALNSEPIGRVMWLHKPAPASPSLVHVSLKGRAEVALFGEPITLKAPIRMLAGPEILVKLDEGDDVCTVCRMSARAGERQKQCSPHLEEVLKSMVEVGASYPDIVAFLHQLKQFEGVSCPVAIEVLPEAVSLDRLVTEGRELGMK